MGLFLGSLSGRAALYARKASGLSVGRAAFAPRVSSVLLVICMLAGSGSVWLFETSFAIAKQRSTLVKKDKKSSIVKKEKSVAARKKQRSFAAKNQKSVVSAKEEARIAPEVRTPVDKHDCIAAAQAFYARAQAVAGGTKQTIPQEFHRLVSKLDEFCGEKEFEKAMIGIDWMNACLGNFRGDKKSDFCSSNKNYYCAIDPGASTCVASGARATD